jgi:hypothetical protein
MTEIQEKHYAQMMSFIEINHWSFSEKEETICKRIDVQNGKFTNFVKVYGKGTIQIQGPESKLKEALLKAKEAIENEESLGDMLPFEIERFPELLKERVPAIDPVIVKFIEEAIITLKAGSNLGCALLLGGASEKTIYLLIDAYKKGIKDEGLKNKFVSRTSGKVISKIFEEFKQSFKSSKNKPQGYGWTNDIETKIEQTFQFCRICRNEAGHPHLPPNLDKGVLLATMGQFVKYVEDLYELIAYYEEHEVEL